MSNTASIKSRIQKLLAQAADQEGTPEGDTFQAKAMELLARYGLTEFDVREDGKDGNEIIAVYREASKKYTLEHQTLYHAIAKALGVFCVRYRKSTRMQVVGTRTNVERTDMLYHSLSLQMWKGASKLSAKMGEEFTTQQKRRSYCYAYASRIMERLEEIEGRVREEVASEGVLVPVNEYAQAEDYYRNIGGRTQKARSVARVDYQASGSARADANRADLGQKRFNGRLALS